VTVAAGSTRLSHPPGSIPGMPPTDLLPHPAPAGPRHARSGPAVHPARVWRFAPFATPVRGYRFAGRPPAADHPRPGQAAGLHREAGHPRDRWAVGVWVRSGDGTPWRIGYLDRGVAARVAPRLDAGATVTATVVGWMPEPDGRWRRPVLRLAPAPGPATGRGGAWVTGAPPAR
jgi:hypothetical protein